MIFDNETPNKIVKAFKMIVDIAHGRPKTSIGVIVVIMACSWLISTEYRGFKQDAAMFESLKAHIAKEREVYPEPADMQRLIEEGSINNIKTNAVLQRMVNAGADRAFLMKFHNGSRDINGMHFLYVSTTNEVTGAGVSNVMSSVQDVQTSMFETNWIENFLKGTCVDIRQREMPKNTAMYGLMSKLGIAQMHICPVNDVIDNRLLGLVGASWIKKEPSKVSEEDVEDVLLGSNLALATLLTPKDIKN